MARVKRANGATPQPTAMDATSIADTDLTGQSATPARNRKPSRTPKSKQAGAPRSKQGHGRPRFTEDQVAEALKVSGGIFSDAARYLTERYRRKVSRPTISRYVASSPRLQRVMDEVDEAYGDYAEAKLKSFIDQGSERSLHFYLSTKAKHRGYTRQMEVTGKNGGPIQTQVQPIDLSNLPHDELAALAELLDRAAEARSIPGGSTPH